ncbi:MAG: IspD/TarI family cytidylyltransferase [Paracoccaceae bacterium]|nr:IspD/TarI family cytidylyltransferase [Paracoccaceae bacterium]
METIAMIVAAGRGRRAGGKIPKQYERSQNERMLSLTIQALLKSTKIDAIIVVINRLDIKLYMDSIKHLNTSRLLNHCFGGTERTETVKNGLTELKKYSPKKLLIHDAARPFISVELIERLLNSLVKNQAVLPVLPIVDAIWEIDDREGNDYNIKPGPNRANLLLAQTPQAFDYPTICSAYNHSKKNKLDDVTIAHEAGIKITTVIGDIKNKKITSKQDLAFFKGIQ